MSRELNRVVAGRMAAGAILGVLHGLGMVSPSFTRSTQGGSGGAWEGVEARHRERLLRLADLPRRRHTPP